MAEPEVQPSAAGVADESSAASAAPLTVRDSVGVPPRRGDRHRPFGPLLDFSPDAIVMVDAHGLVREWNPAAVHLFASLSATAVNAPLRDVLAAQHRDTFDTAWLRLLAGEAVPPARMAADSTGGTPRAVEVTVAPIRAGAELAGAVVILREPTPHAWATSEATPGARAPSSQAEHHGPAGLPDRHWVQRRLSEPLAAGMQRGVAACDIDTFAMLMATHGPDAADAVLTRFGEILIALKTPGTFAHWREDTFVWIVDCAEAAPALDATVAALREALHEPFLVESERIWLTTSIGLATTAIVGGGDLLAAASDAMEVARRAGGSNCTYYEESMESGASSGFRLANELHHAIDHDELRLHFQPIMDLATNEISGVEALVRWERPRMGLLTPAHFIDAAERTGQIVPLGNWVISKACESAPRLGHHSLGARTMSINVSARQLADPGLITTIRGAIASGRCAPSTIVIEVTESVLLDDLSSTAASLEAIKALEVGLDLDDFGTGYSSLQYLKNLPIDRVKVDQSFVAGLGTDATDTAIIASTIALAHSLGLHTVAEGVETEEQLTLLRAMGCDYVQGYLISRPIDLESLTAWLDAYVPIAPVPSVGMGASAASPEMADATQAREAQADSREHDANSRETRADERDRAADVRDATAAQREDDDSGSVDAATRSTRRNAERSRGRARSVRELKAEDRAQATKVRHEASTHRADEASRPTSTDDGTVEGP